MPDGMLVLARAANRPGLRLADTLACCKGLRSEIVRFTAVPNCRGCIAARMVGITPI